MSRSQAQPGAGARRWPDLMIGALVLLLVGGFGTVLLRGSTESAPQAGTAAATPNIPAAPGTAMGEPATTDTPAASTIAPPQATSETTPPQSTAPATQTAETQAPATEEAPVIAAVPIGQPDPALQAPAPTAPQPDVSTAEPAATAPATEATTSAPTPRTEGAVAASEQRVPLRSDYRISLGTFGSEEGARSAGAGVSALGYTVYPIDLGTQVVAQLGPFSDEASARLALADVQRAYPNAVLYPPRGRSLTGGAATTPAPAETAAAPAPATTPAVTPQATAPSAEPSAPTQPAPAPDGPTYLQVGAFDRVESAQNLVQQLRDLGYAPTVSAPEGRKVTVLVGPYNGDALGRTESRLSDNGLDHFRVR